MSVHAQQAVQAVREPQPAPPAKDADPAMQTVEVRGAADAYDPRRDDTASKIVVNHDEIVKYGDTSVYDVLKRVPGVTVSGSGGRGSEIRMRGLGGGYTQILINGERAPAGFSLDSLAPDVIERIEVLRAASAEFSTQSIAGTINVILKKTVRTAQREVKANYGHATNAANRGVNLQLSDKAGQLSYSLAANAFRASFNDGSATVEEFLDAAGNRTGLRRGTTDPVGRFTMLNLTPRLNWTFANGDTLTSQTFASMFRLSNAIDKEVDTVAGPPPAYPLLAQRTRADNRFFREELNWVHKLAGGARLDAKVGANYAANESGDWRDGAGNPAAGTLSDTIDSDSTERGVTTQGKYTSARWEGHALAFGWDAGHAERDDARRERDWRHPDAVVPDGDETYSSTVSRLAVYAQDEWNVTPRWSLYLGARWEGIRTRTEGESFGTGRSRSAVLSPLMQTLYKLPDSKGDQVRLALTRTYKAPGLQSLIPHRVTSINNSQTEPDAIGNPDLKPELALGVDASYEHYWAEGALLSASVSTRRIQDYTRNLTVFDGARWVSTPSNAGDARTYGLELEARFPLKAVMATTTALDLRASVSRNWSSVDSVPGPDNRLNAQVPLSATLGADYKTGPLTLGGSYVFKTGGPVRIAVNQYSYQSVRRDLDMYALWKFDPKLQLRVTASNLLAQDYVSAGTYLTPGVGSQTLLTTAPGRRMVRGTLEMKF
ncbi:TonB-dependent siderophore receptor [uncultured Massilia sp.]|uniref:TonB-dependent receptor plug domain-containing protein n=1 Tax=uncultured Massilia sp. TaxID=169973 RepID=UPI0025E952D9|nr:TonB-dependent receptor [uncultured Massilia sp.]